jgi:serine/threonine-protein kinase
VERGTSKPDQHGEQIMKTKGPVLTLLVGLVLAATVFGLSVAANRTASAGQRETANAATSATGLAAPTTATSTEGTSVTPLKAPSAPITYAGRVDGGAVAIAIAVRDGQGIAYVCNGKRLEAWFQGPAGDGQLALTGKAAGSSITGTHDGQFAAGTVAVAGQKFTFRIPMVQAPAGLYRIADKVANASIQGGWIVYDGGQTGTVTVNGRTGAAPPLNTETGEVIINGVAVKPPRL